MGRLVIVFNYVQRKLQNTQQMLGFLSWNPITNAALLSCLPMRYCTKAGPKNAQKTHWLGLSEKKITNLRNMLPIIPQ